MRQKFLFFILFVVFHSFGQLKVEVNKKVCDHSMMNFIGMTRNQYSDIILKDNNLSIDLGLIANCEMNFKFLARISSDQDTLYLDYFNNFRKAEIEDSIIEMQEEIIAACDCFFNTELIISEIEIMPTTFFLRELRYSHVEKNKLESVKPYKEIHYSNLNGLPKIPIRLPKRQEEYNKIDENGNKIGIWKSKINKFMLYEHFVPNGKTKTEVDLTG